MSAPDTIVLVHGFWVTPRSWEEWNKHYEGRGFRVLDPGIPRLRGGGRGSQHRPLPDRGPRARDHREVRVGDRRARRAADHHRPLGGRGVHSDAARPRLRVGRRGAQLGADRGRPGGAARAGEGDAPVLKNPANRHKAVGLHPRPVALRVHEHVQRGGVRAALQALPHACLRDDLLGQRARQPAARPPGDVGRLQERRSRAAAVHLGVGGPPDAAEDPAVQRQALQVRHGHRDQGVRGPAPAAAAHGWQEVADYALDWAVERS